MEALNRSVDFKFGSFRNNLYIHNNSKQSSSLALGYRIGCNIFAIPLWTLSIPRATERRKNYSVTAAFKRISEAPRRRNALRHKLTKELQVWDPNFKIPDNAFIEKDILSGKKKSQDMENNSGEGFNERLEGFQVPETEDTANLNVYGEEGILVEENNYQDLDYNSNESFREGLEKKSTGSKFWDTLQSLNSQLEKDAEEWGVGMQPVFTLYENSEGGIERVIINEDAIWIRLRIQPMAAEFADEDQKSVANARIARARLLAKEIEIGAFRPPRNSTAFKFVKPGGSLIQKGSAGLGSALGQVRAVYIRVPAIVKLSVVGLAIVYGFCFLWTARKSLFGDVKQFGEKERKRMLERKMKSRMEREKMDRDLAGKDGRVSDSESLKGKPGVYEGSELVKEVDSVDVYKDSPNMSEAERHKRVLATMTSKGKLPMDDREFDRKVEMIQAMAREAREMEQKKAGKNVDNLEDSNAVFDRDTNGSASTSGPIDVSAMASTLVDNDKERKTAEVTITKNEHINLQTRILSAIFNFQKFSNSNQVKRVNVANSNATDGNGLDTSDSVADQMSKGNTKESRAVDVSASVVTVMDYKSNEHGIANGSTTNEDKFDSPSIADWSKGNTKEFGPGDVPLSAVTGMDFKGNENGISDGTDTKEQKLDLGSIANSGSKAKTKESRPVNVPVSAVTVMACKGTENGILNGAITKDEKLDLANVTDSGSKDNTKESRPVDVPASAVSGMDYKSNENGNPSRATVKEPMSQSGTEDPVIRQEPKAQNRKHLNKSDSKSAPSQKSPRRMKPRVITSVEEARALLASKFGEPSNDASGDIEKHTALNGSNGRIQEKDFDEKKVSSDPFMPPSPDFSVQELSIANDSTAAKQTELSINGRLVDVNYEKLRPPFKKAKIHEKEKVPGTKARWEGRVHSSAATISKHAENEGKIESDGEDSDASETDEENESMPPEEADDFDWTKDEALCKIVFKVKANEEAGKEPFDGLDSKAEELFYQGIEKRIGWREEKVNKWISENVENLDYGKDGIAYDDPPEVFMARWKDPDKQKGCQFLDKFQVDREEFIKTKMKLYPPFPETESSSKIAKSTSISESSTTPTNSTFGITDTRHTSHSDSSTSAKTVISSSGKSSKSVKGSKRKSWQKTKKWSRSLQERYNAEKDPEIKAIIKEMGQDLDKWMTEEDMEETSQVLQKSTEKQLKNIKTIKERIKNESEKFGREAMLNKYREYKPKSEDHLWWIDLPYVMCIELFRDKDGEKMRGFYSLEMDPDLDPKIKCFHVVAFEDRGDAKNFCHLLRSTLKNGFARVIPRIPKELYREAKSEGYKVTVIKKAQIQLHIDQPLDQVEGMITAIGSDIYYDKILHDSAIDMDSVIKDGFVYRGPK